MPELIDFDLLGRTRSAASRAQPVAALSGEWLDRHDVAAAERRQQQLDRGEIGVVATGAERDRGAAVVARDETVVSAFDGDVVPMHQAILPDRRGSMRRRPPASSPRRRIWTSSRRGVGVEADGTRRRRGYGDPPAEATAGDAFDVILIMDGLAARGPVRLDELAPRWSGYLAHVPTSVPADPRILRRYSRVSGVRLVKKPGKWLGETPGTAHSKTRRAPLDEGGQALGDVARLAVPRRQCLGAAATPPPAEIASITAVAAPMLCGERLAMVRAISTARCADQRDRRRARPRRPGRTSARGRRRSGRPCRAGTSLGPDRRAGPVARSVRPGR